MKCKLNSTDGLAAVTWRGSVSNLECAPVIAGPGFCVVSWGDIQGGASKTGHLNNSCSFEDRKECLK